MKNILFVIGLLVFLVSCKPEPEEIEPLVSVRVKGSEIVLVDPQTNEPLKDPETGKPLKITPCVAEAEAAGKEKLPICAVLDSKFKALQIARVDSTFSEKSASSVRCAITFIVDGRSYQFTYDFPTSNACPKDWYRI